MTEVTIGRHLTRLVPPRLGRRSLRSLRPTYRRTREEVRGGRSKFCPRDASRPAQVTERPTAGGRSAGARRPAVQLTVPTGACSYRREGAHVAAASTAAAGSGSHPADAAGATFRVARVRGSAEPRRTLVVLPSSFDTRIVGEQSPLLRVVGQRALHHKAHVLHWGHVERRGAGGWHRSFEIGDQLVQRITPHRHRDFR